MALREEAKRARVKKHSGVPQMSSPLERREDESRQRTSPKARSMMMNVTDPPSDLQDATLGESAGPALGLSHAMGHGLQSPRGVQRFGKLGPPMIGRESR
jgi:hypothetical protein